MPQSLESKALSRIAFGSCHSRNAFDNGNDAAIGSPPISIWDVIRREVNPQAFLWTGDAVYPPRKVKGDAPLHVLIDEYRNMLFNSSIGYSSFRKGIVVSGTWDDHDYGGNDRGKELPSREKRRDAFLDFLGVSPNDDRRNRLGVYSSIDLGEEGRKVKVIFLDTRFHRDTHCIPSVGANPSIPLGALVACTTRLLTAGLSLPSFMPKWSGCTNDIEMLGDEQWEWLENEVELSDASVNIIVSSVQVLTSNPVVESWGHFPDEKRRLIKLISKLPGLVLLSGDVHHAEVLTAKPKRSLFDNDLGSIIEVTSSGLTHSCEEPFYGPLCAPILDAYQAHRYLGANVQNASLPSYYTGRNFGSITFDWEKRVFQVKIHDAKGRSVLEVQLKMDRATNLAESTISMPQCIDGSFLPIFVSCSGSLAHSLH